MGKETQEVPQTALTLIEGSSQLLPREKVVFKMTDGQQVVAAKIYKEMDLDSRQPINRPLRAREEFDAYQYFRKTPIGIYIPKPLYLLNDEHGQTVGLAVEWKDGTQLNRLHPKKPLTQQVVNELGERICALDPEEHLAHPDMYNEANLLFDPTSPQQIWLAECRFISEPERRQYQQYMYQELLYLKNTYV